MHPLFTAHGAFDYIAIKNAKICAVNRLTVMVTIAPIMLRFVHEFLMSGPVAPFGCINPQSNAVAFEKITHSIPPTKLNFVQDLFNNHANAQCIIGVIAYQQFVNALHGVNQPLQASRLGFDEHFTIRVRLFDCICYPLRHRIAFDVLQSVPSFV
jgi:hypothetical protein